jgi:hypothetical protein
MTWLVELPDADGMRMLVNLDEPVVIRGDRVQSSIVTGLGSIPVGLDYDTLCARLRLNPADRMSVADPARRALGRLPAKRDARVPALAALAPDLRAAPDRYTDYCDAVPNWILGRNDEVGDCTCVGPANVILALSTLARRPRRLSDAEIVALYSRVSGYRADDPDSDQGAMIEDVLAAWHGAGIDGDRLDGYARIPPGEHGRIRQAIALLGPVDVGLDLPAGWLKAPVWDVSTAGGTITGGHCVTAVGYSADGPLVVSWGKLYALSWAGWDRYVDEAHALLSRDALTRAGRDASGVDWDTLARMMAIIREDA